MIELDAQQSEAVERAMTHDGFALFPEPRVGKTRMSIEIVNRRKPERLLIIGPKVVLPVWRKSFADLIYQPEIHLTNYEQVVNRSRRRKLSRWLSKKSSMVILDEAHHIKRRSSKQSRACRSFTAKSDWRLALTGTPIAQGLYDSWAIFDFLNPKIFGDWKNFTKTHLVKGGYQGRKIVGYRNLSLFNDKFHEYSARIQLNEVADRKLKIRRKIEEIELSDTARYHYDQLERELVTATRVVHVEAPLVITLTLRLQQICGGFLSNGEDIEQIDRGKLIALGKVLDERKSPIVICARYLPEINAIKRLVKSKGIPVIEVRGGMPLEKPFTEGVIIVQQQSGEGIDLSAADLLVFYSWNYSYINYEQMRFRVLSRQRTRVDYLFLMAKNTVDSLIYQAVIEKRRLSDVVCDHYRRNR